jgi:hypothetical protein
MGKVAEVSWRGSVEQMQKVGARKVAVSGLPAPERFHAPAFVPFD